MESKVQKLTEDVEEMTVEDEVEVVGEEEVKGEEEEKHIDRVMALEYYNFLKLVIDDDTRGSISNMMSVKKEMVMRGRDRGELDQAVHQIKLAITSDILLASVYTDITLPINTYVDSDTNQLGSFLKNELIQRVARGERTLRVKDIVVVKPPPYYNVGEGQIRVRIEFFFGVDFLRPNALTGKLLFSG